MAEDLASPEPEASPSPGSAEESDDLPMAPPKMRSMQQSEVLDDVPDVYACFVHQNEEGITSLHSSRAKRLSAICKREYSKSFTDFARAMLESYEEMVASNEEEKKSDPSSSSADSSGLSAMVNRVIIKTVSLLSVEYSLILIPASEEVVCLFLVDKEDHNVKRLHLEDYTGEEGTDRETMGELILPFLDSSLCYFLSRVSLFGDEFAGQPKGPGPKHASLRSSSVSSSPGKASLTGRRSLKPRSRRMSMRETYSLEEVFRTLDIKGKGSLTAKEFYKALQSMGTVEDLTEEDVELVFRGAWKQSKRGRIIKFRTGSAGLDSPVPSGDAAGASDEQEFPEEFAMNYASFFQFFGAGKNLMKPSLRSPMGSKSHGSGSKLSPTSPAGMPMLSVLQEEDDSKSAAPSAPSSGGGGTSAVSPREKHRRQQSIQSLGFSAAEAEKIESLKQSILDMLNMDKDYGVLSTVATTKLKVKTPTSKKSKKKKSMISVGDVSIDASTFDVNKVVEKLHKIELLVPLMQGNVFICCESMKFHKWNNRFLSHKERLANLTTIVGKVLHLKLQSVQANQEEMRADITRLEKDLKKAAASPVHRASRSGQRTPGGIEDAMAGFGLSGPPKRSRSGRHIAASPSSSTHHRRGSSFASFGGQDHDDSDTASVDSEADLVYKESSEKVSKKMAKFRHESRRQKLQITELQSELKVQAARYENTIKRLNTKIDILETDKREMAERNQRVKKRMKEMKGGGGGAGSRSRTEEEGVESVEVQRATMSLRREMRNLVKELDKEREARSNLQKRLKRALAASKKDSGAKTGDENVTTRRIEKFRKELEKREAEVKLKQQKLDEFFLKIKKYENQIKAMEKKLKKAQEAQAAAERQALEYKAAADGAKSAGAEIDSLNKQLEKLRNKVDKQSATITKWKAKNAKLKVKIEKLLSQLEELAKMQAEFDQLRSDLDALNKEKLSLQIELEKAGGKNADLEARLASLDERIAQRRADFEKAQGELEKFKAELDEEQQIIRELQESLEDKDQQIADKDEEIAVRLARLEGLLEKKDAVIAKYKAQLESSQSENQMLNEKIQMMQISLDNKDEELEDVRNNIETCNMEIEQLQKRIIEAEEVKASSEEITELEEKVDSQTEEIIELQDEVKEIQEKHSEIKEKLKLKNDEFEELLRKWESMKAENETVQQRIKKLKQKVTRMEEEKMKVDDETEMKVRQFEVQVITIEKSSNRIRELEAQLLGIQTDYELKIEECDSLSKTKSSLLDQIGGLEETIAKQKTKIREMKTKLDASGYGDVKKGSELELLRKNVTELESIRSTLEWEKKKLQRKLTAYEGGASASAAGEAISGMRSPEEEKKWKSLNTENTKLKKVSDKQKRQISELKATMEELKSKSEGLEGMLKKKNEQISKLKSDLRASEDAKDALAIEVKKEADSSRRLSKNMASRDTELASISEELEEAQKQLKKIPEFEKKIRELEDDLESKQEDIKELNIMLGETLDD